LTQAPRSTSSTGPSDGSHPKTGASQYNSRKEVRVALKKLSRAERAIMAGPSISVGDVATRAIAADAPARRAKAVKRKSNILSTAVMALVVPGLFATLALPAYAYSPSVTAETKSEKATASVMKLKQTGAQTVAIASNAKFATVARDAFTATSVAELKRKQFAATYTAYTGPSAADYLKNPPYPKFDLAKVVGVAEKYRGVPYVYGGANPSGFDCSGFTMYVYAQFGVALPHSASAQGRLGTPISRADALPGDLVVMNDGGHVGIYVSPGVFIDAPLPGGVVSVRPIYTDAYFIVRIGI
jgi:peptidoglycan DL-endopeptidase CwlO